ncbi:MAG TPA: arginine--tRNA ligase [Desulfobacteraceae bacterium]|nr:arginine--tRNA ligase [Desulfobacteraceae bacterium]
MIETTLEKRVKNAIIRLFGKDYADMTYIQKTANSQFGDYQSNFALNAARSLGKKPRDIATALADELRTDPVIEKVDVAGPGFINMTLTRDFLSLTVFQGISPEKEREEEGVVIIDYSSPNIAKPMHVGHLRSTVIGDSIKRIYRFLGYTVIADSHLGDWGTQFGKLIVAFRRWLDKEAYSLSPVDELERIYVKFAREAENDPALEDEARRELVKLQDHDPENMALWQEFVNVSLSEYDKVYKRLGITFDTMYGESHYHDLMPSIVSELLEKDVARISEGAVVVFFDEEENLHPCIIRKKDGAFLYATSELACIAFRKENYTIDRVLYVTDARQETHFKQIFAIADRLGWDLGLVHIPFGLMGLKDGHFSTRKGNVIKLRELIEEAVSRARAVVEEKNPELSNDEKAAIAEAVGIGAVKYADLSQNRLSNVTFDWDKMLSFEGNTAPYLQYTYARIRSLFRKAQETGLILPRENCITIGNETERALALSLIQFSYSIRRAAESYRPNLIADQLFDIAQKYNTFYNSLPVLKEDRATALSRLQLSVKTGEVLKEGLELLGIVTVERM